MKKPIGLAVSFLGFLLFVSPLRAESGENPRQFLASLRARSGGAGHGGNALLSEFFRSAQEGLDQLALFSSPGLIAQLRERVEWVRVYPVDFRLCDSPDVTDCPSALTRPARGYADLKVILIDVRSSGEGWTALSGTERRERAIIAVSEALGAPTNEAQLLLPEDQEARLSHLAQFGAVEERDRFFRGLNDYYGHLPSIGPTEVAGAWRASAFVSTEGAIQVEPAGAPATSLPVSSRTLPWRGSTRLHFSPKSYGVSVSRIADFECKQLDADRLVCRDLRDRRNEGYVFYRRDI